MGCGLVGRKEKLAQRAVGACRCIVLAVVEVSMWPVRKRKGGRRGLVLEGCVLFTVGLQASSLGCFLLLMRVPSGLLRVSWPSPRKEMMQLAPHLPGCALIRNTKREGLRQRLLVMLKNCENTTETQGFCWVDTHLSALEAVSEGSLSSGDRKGSDRMYPFVLSLTPLLSCP